VLGASAGLVWGATTGLTAGVIQGFGVALGNVNAAARNQFDYFMNWHFLDALIKGHVDKDTARFKRRAEDQHFRNDAELKAFFTSVAGLSSRTLTAMRAALAMEPTQAREVLSEAERQMGEVTDFHPKPQPTFESARDIERRIREKGLAIKVIEEAGKK